MAAFTKTKIGGVVAAIIAAVFALEAGYSNNPDDPGGETNHGITKEVAVEHGYTDPMKLLPKELAGQIYYEDYIVKPGFLAMTELSPAVAEKLVDAGVNAGPSRPSRWFQSNLNSLSRGGKDYPLINVDGKVGPATIVSYKGLERVRGKVGACQLMIKLLDAQQAMYYVSLNNLPMFTPGWVANRIGNVPLSKCTKYEINTH